jgi:hypothetical protein
MKKLIFALTALFTMTVTANAMSYEQARDQALFLTDKMAYELNLTEDQYEAAYEINLDYLMSIDHYDDLYGVYWTRRNLDLSYILLDWQYSAYCAASYFYRPLYWEAGYWHFGIYARYPHRTYFYFGRPHFYLTYRGGHSWRMNGGRSWYHGRTFGASHRHGHDRHGFGMRNGFDRGDFRSHSGHFERRQGGRALERRNDNGNHSFNRGNRGGERRYDNNRSTERRSDNIGSRSIGSRSNGTFSGSRNSGSFGNRENVSSSRERSSSIERSTPRSSSVNRSNGNFGSRQSSTRSYSESRSSSRGSFSAPSRSFSSGRSGSSSRSVSAPSSRGGGSHSGSFSSGSRGGGSHGGGSHGGFGGRR